MDAGVDLGNTSAVVIAGGASLKKTGDLVLNKPVTFNITNTSAGLVEATSNIDFSNSAVTANFSSTLGDGTYSFNLFDFVTNTGNTTLNSITLAGAYSGVLNGAGGFSLVSGVDSWSFDHSTGILGLTVSSIPEPSAISVLAGLGVFGIVAYRRRRGV